MEKEQLEQTELNCAAPEQAPYTPRPRWQVWLARIGLVAFLILLFCYYYLMFSKGGV